MVNILCEMCENRLDKSDVNLSQPNPCYIPPPTPPAPVILLILSIENFAKRKRNAITQIPIYPTIITCHFCTHAVNKVGAYVGCFILAEFFNLPCLSQLCLAHIQSVLVVESALSLVRFAETVGSPLLHQLAVEFLKLHHKP